MANSSTNVAGGSHEIDGLRPMSLKGMFNMCFGFFGIQFGWGLQMANMSAIYSRLGAKESELPWLWLAAPLTGLIVQPIVGYYSDHTWGSLGRRRPYFLVGAILATIALIVMPHSNTLLMAAVLLWVLDAAVNVTMEPFRAFVGDLLPESQRRMGFAMQSLFIGAGAVISSALPWMFAKAGVSSQAEPGHIPMTVVMAFTVGAVVYLTAVLYTIVTTQEHPPRDLEEFRRRRAAAVHPLRAFEEIFKGLFTMPKVMVSLAVVQFFTWCGLFLMWLYFSVGLSTRVFGAVEGTPAFEEASNWAGVCFSVYNGVAFAFAFVLIAIGKRMRAKVIHAVCLLLGGIGLMAYGLPMLGVALDKQMVLVPMVGVGIAWASILSMPYALLSNVLPPEKMGFYMGVFNFFIVLPQILASVAFGRIMEKWLGNNALSAVVIGGACFVIAAVVTMVVREAKK